VTAVWVLSVLGAFAVGMAVTSAVAVRWSAFAQGPLRTSVVEFVLMMMAGMFAGVLGYFAVGGTSGVVTGLWIAAAIMSASVLVVFVGFLQEFRRGTGAVSPSPDPTSRMPFVATVIALVIANEFLMGWSFSLLAGSLAPGLGPGASQTWSVLSAAVTSPWFVFPMALEMILTLRWLWADFPRFVRRFLLLQPAIMVCSPPTLGGIVWLLGTTLAAAVLMAVAVALFLLALFRDEAIHERWTAYVVAFLLALGLMAGGLYVWIAFGRAELFALALLAQMAVFLFAVCNPRWLGGSPVSGSASPSDSRPVDGRAMDADEGP